MSALIRSYYDKPGNEMGGNLHITLDDGNIETIHVRFCRQKAQEAGDVDGIQIAELLLAMSRRQRAKAVGR